MIIKRFILRYVFIVLTFLGVFSTYPKAVHEAQAQEPVGDVIEISTPEGFQNINNDLTAHYVIVNDIDFAGFELTQIASNSNQPFEGTLDGNGFILSNITIPKTFDEILDYSRIGKKYSHSLIRFNEGTITDIYIERISYGQSLISNQYYDDQGESNVANFSIFENNLGTITNISVNWSEHPILFQGPNGPILINISLFSLDNRGSIQHIKIKYSSLSPWKISSAQAYSISSYPIIRISGFATFNYGLIEEGFISFNSQFNLNSNEHILVFSGAVYENHISGVIRNIHLITNIKTIFFTFDLLNDSFYLYLRLAGIVYLNYGLVEYYYNTGDFNIVFPNGRFSTQNNIVLSKTIITNTSLETNDNPGVDTNGFTDLKFLFFTLSKTPVINFITDISVIYPTNFSISNSNYIVVDTYIVGYLSENFHDLYTFNNDFKSDEFGSSPFVNDFDGYVFNLDHFSIIEQTIESTTPGLTSSTSLELSQQLLTSDAWSPAQLSEINAFVLASVTLLPFELTNYSIQAIGTSYTVSEDFNVSLNGVPLDIGTHYLNDPGQFLFTLHDPIFNITNTVSVIVYSEDSILPEGTYQGTFTPQLDEGTTATLNGESYVLGTSINTPGQHQLIIFGENNYTVEYNFTIDLVVTGINNNTNYSDAVTPILSGGTATLNGEPYTSNTLIDKVGIYELIITGVNGFSETYTFTILPNKGDLDEGESYLSGYTPIISGEGITMTLNGDPYTTNTPIILAGEYELIIQGLNGYSETINFTIDLNLFNSIQHEAEYRASVTPHFEGGYATLNGEQFESNTTIHEVGNHTLLIYGLNDELLKTIEFTIIENLINPIEGSPTSYTPNFEGVATYTLNGFPYTPGTPITTPGEYILIVNGLNGYSETYEFTITLAIGGLQNATKTSPYKLTFTGGTATLNGDPFTSGDTVSNVGHYELIIVGVGEFIEKRTFTITPFIQNVVHLNTYINSVTPTITGEGMTITFNGEVVDNVNYTMTNPGINTIVISGIGEFTQTISFTINPTIDAPVNNAVLVNELVELSWTGGIARLNGDILSNNSLNLNSIGHYIFTVHGVNNDFVQSHEFTIRPLVENLANSGNYSGPIEPNIIATNGTVLLNGNPYNNERITTPGTHTLLIQGLNSFSESYTFFVGLITVGFSNNTTYINQLLTITFSGGEATLNGVLIESGHTTQSVGNYTLVIRGVNTFIRTYRFTIDPDVNFDPEQTHTYSGTFTPEIEGEGFLLTLNNQPYDGSALNMPGAYTLRITSPIGNYSMIYEFSISLVAIDIQTNKTYTDWITPTFSGGNITLNGETYTSGTRIETIGEFTLVVRGTFDFEVTYIFTILPYSITMPQANSSHPSFVYQVNGIHTLSNLTINGVAYRRSLTFIKIGHYDVIITFNGEELLSQRFTIEPNDYYEDGTVFDAPLILDYPHGDLYVNGNLYEDGYRMDQHGTYTIVIRGVNNYEHTYTLIFDNPNIDRMNLLLMPLAFSMALPAVAYVIRRRRVV